MSETTGTVAESIGAAADGPVPASPLTPYQKRKQRERELEAEAAAKKAKREARGAAPAKGAPAAQGEAAAVEKFDERKAVKVLGVFVRGCYRVARIVLALFGTLDPLTDDEITAQAEHLVSYAVAFPKFYRLATWLAWPFLFADLVASKFSRKAKKTETAKP